MFKTWMLAVAGLVAFAVLVWVAGPLVVIGGQAPLASTPARLVVIGVFTLQYLAQKLWRLQQAKRRNEQVLSALAPAADPGLSAEAAQLRERFSTALAELRQARFTQRGWSFGRSYLYQLPWYLIIGAPGTGKTTALLNSGLEFPLARKLGRGAVGGFGGTRNCDWWFTDRAVLIDTAGRYTTQDSDRTTDRKGWDAFLGLLQDSRPASCPQLPNALHPASGPRPPTALRPASTLRPPNALRPVSGLRPATVRQPRKIPPPAGRTPRYHNRAPMRGPRWPRARPTIRPSLSRRCHSVPG